jgi:hypothetical protein
MAPTRRPAAAPVVVDGTVETAEGSASVDPRDALLADLEREAEIAARRAEIASLLKDVPAPPAIYGAMLRAQRAVGAVAKASRNEQQGFNFRGIDAVVNSVGPALREAGVLVLPTVTRLDYDPVQVERRRGDRVDIQHSIQVRAHVTYRFVAEDGSSVEVAVVGEAIDYGDKGVSKAMSVGLRIALLQTFSIPTDDPDPDTQVYERGRVERGHVPSSVPAADRPKPPYPPHPDFAPAAAAPPPPPPAEPYQGTDDDFAIDVANLEEMGEAGLEPLRQLWRQAAAAGRPDLADSVSQSVARIKQATEQAGA